MDRKNRFIPQKRMQIVYLCSWNNEKKGKKHVKRTNVVLIRLRMYSAV